MKRRRRKAQSVEREVLARIRGSRGGRVFTPADFLDLGGRDAVGAALARGVRAGRIRKLARGLYDLPRRGADGTPFMPTTEAIVRALSGREAIRFQPSGANAANMLGLSEQVPVRIVFLTDGRARKVTLGQRTIVLRRAAPRQMATAGRKSGLIIQALRWMGKHDLGDSTMAKLRKQVSEKDRKDLLQATRHAPAWIAQVLRELARHHGT